MISLKKYLDSAYLESSEQDRDPEQNLLGVAIDAYGSVLQEVGNSCQCACPCVGGRLQQVLGELRKGLSPTMECSALSATDVNVREQLQSWGRDTALHYRQKTDEVKEILLVMTRTAESVSARDLRCAGQMSAVTDRLRAIASLDDLSEIRTSIEESAAELKSSIERMAEEGKAAINHLQMQIVHYQAKLEEAEEIATRDALTGLSSRLYVESQIKKRIDADASLCVAIIDIDGFKNVNDTYGHLVGDELLKQFGSELKLACRSSDLIGRWGGDEFILLLDCSCAEAEKQIERIRKWICGNYAIETRSGTIKLSVKASFGLSSHAPGMDMPELLARADAAMYEQKAQSRRKRDSS